MQTQELWLYLFYDLFVTNGKLTLSPIVCVLCEHEWNLIMMWYDSDYCIFIVYRSMWNVVDGVFCTLTNHSIQYRWFNEMSGWQSYGLFSFISHSVYWIQSNCNLMKFVERFFAVVTVTSIVNCRGMAWLGLAEWMDGYTVTVMMLFHISTVFNKYTDAMELECSSQKFVKTPIGIYELERKY